MEMTIHLNEKAEKLMAHKKDLKTVLKIIGDMTCEVGHGVEKNYLSASFENLQRAQAHITSKLHEEITKAAEIEEGD